MQNLGLSESTIDVCNLDMDNFIKTLSSIKERELRPELIGPIITHYASKWLPELSDEGPERSHSGLEEARPESATASWVKKKFFIETIIGILPPEKDSVPCDFLLRLLRIASMVQAEPAYQADLENRVSWQLDRASLKDLIIPSFSYTCTTLLDFDLILRLVKKFVNTEAVRSRAAVTKVAKLVDCYLAEAAADSHLRLSEFVALASILPGHARATDDGLYRAVDTYLKAHPGLSKQDRKTLCSLIDTKKLSQEASFHASQNERLPVRAVIQVLLSEQTKLDKHIIDWSRSLSRAPSPIGLDVSARSFSKRETMSFHQIETIRRLKEDVLRLQSQCMAMEKQIEKLLEKKKSYGFSWKKLGIQVFKGNRIGEVEGEDIGLLTPLEMKGRFVRGRAPNRRKSMS
ncbi:hypothetical protein BUALT_Bualt02G0111600 [Buddleja alternifolia]|uniref:NPH3 domain-containing protein n=1 Tax=Buddleja alternifolia TaxID=168488 RepID=A0AAV6XZU0_9LAMI|nr:hypothetical protein BUALT_Bualt02G0111600 [Buddleja alternifolia]